MACGGRRGVSARLAAAPTGDCACGTEALAHNAGKGSAGNTQPRKRRRKCADTAAGANPRMNRAQGMERSAQCPKRQNAKPRVLRKRKLSGDYARGAAGHGHGFGGSACWRLRAWGAGAWARAWRQRLLAIARTGRAACDAGTEAQGTRSHGNDGANARTLRQAQACTRYRAQGRAARAIARGGGVA